jgi:hypothetical protein
MQNAKVKSDKGWRGASVIAILHFDFCILKFDLHFRELADSRCGVESSRRAKKSTVSGTEGVPYRFPVHFT